TEYYLATNKDTGITTSTSGWTTQVQKMSSTKKYLWNYERSIYTDGSEVKSDPVIIGVYGDKGKSVVGIVNYYLATDVDNGITTSTSGWTTEVQRTTEEKRYLWN